MYAPTAWRHPEIKSFPGSSLISVAIFSSSFLVSCLKYQTHEDKFSDSPTPQGRVSKPSLDMFYHTTIVLNGATLKSSMKTTSHTSGHFLFAPHLLPLAFDLYPKHPVCSSPLKTHMGVKLSSNRPWSPSMTMNRRITEHFVKSMEKICILLLVKLSYLKL